MAMANYSCTLGEVKINDCVKIDGRIVGRIMSIVKPLGTYNMYNVQTDARGMMQVARFQVIAETVNSSVNLLNCNGLNEKHIPQEVIDDFLNDDLFL